MRPAESETLLPAPMPEEPEDSVKEPAVPAAAPVLRTRFPELPDEAAPEPSTTAPVVSLAAVPMSTRPLVPEALAPLVKLTTPLVSSPDPLAKIMFPPATALEPACSNEPTRT